MTAEMMTAGAVPAGADPNRVGHDNRGGQGNDAIGVGETGPASKRVTVGFGFWIYLLSDIVMFSAFFAAYAVLSGNTAGGPSGHDLFDLHNVAVETGLLLASSLACGMATIASKQRMQIATQAALAITGLLGLAFLVLEIREFIELIARDAGPTHSAFLSAFFAVVGLHGAHITVGLIWLAITMAQILVKGFRDDIMRRLLCFTLFWHALDIIWVALITNVYLMGMTT